MSYFIVKDKKLTQANILVKYCHCVYFLLLLPLSCTLLQALCGERNIVFLLEICFNVCNVRVSVRRYVNVDAVQIEARRVRQILLKPCMGAGRGTL